MKTEYIDFNNPRDRIINAECESVARKFERRSGVSRVKAIWRCDVPKDFDIAKPYELKVLNWEYCRKTNDNSVNGNYLMILDLQIENKLIFQCGGKYLREEVANESK